MILYMKRENKGRRLSMAKKLTTEKEIIVELMLQLKAFAELFDIEREAKERAYQLLDMKGLK